ADGHRRQRHGNHRHARGRRTGCTGRSPNRPACVHGQAHRRGPAPVRTHGCGARTMDRESPGRPRRRRAGAGLSATCAPEAAPANKHRGTTQGTCTMSATMDPQLAAGNRVELATYRAQHFEWVVDRRVATITLARPERKNPLTFASYAELRDLF